MTRGMLAAIIVGVIVVAFDWVGIVHLGMDGALGRRRATIERNAVLANQRAIMEHFGLHYTAPIYPPGS